MTKQFHWLTNSKIINLRISKKATEKLCLSSRGNLTPAIHVTGNLRYVFKLSLEGKVIHLLFAHLPKFCLSYVSNSCWDDCNTQEKLKAKVMQNVWVQTMCIMKDRCANGGDSIHSNSLSTTHKGGFLLGL